MKRKKSVRSSGFGAKLENEGNRLINKDGSYNVEKTGVPFLKRFNLFHTLITMPFWGFLGSMFLIYLGINSFFACIYVALGVENLGLVGQSTGMKFLNAFFFSCQTLTTVGYGAIAPNGVWPNVVASIEAFVGLLTFAMATGLLYGRFSKPKARFIYSDNALISPYRDGKGMMFRLANATNTQLLNVSTKVMLAYVDIETSQRKFEDLSLEMGQLNALPTSWTVVHPINEESPFFNETLESLTEKDSEILISIEGFDKTYSEMVYSRTSYKFDEMVFGAKFKPILGKGENGKALVNLREISTYDLV